MFKSLYQAANKMIAGLNCRRVIAIFPVSTFACFALIELLRGMARNELHTVVGMRHG
jgi:hypothetical protein